MTLKLFFGILSIIPAVFAYVFYFKDIFAGRTKPHAFSWLIWGTLAAIGFFAQVGAHAGIGAWVTGLTSAASLAIFCLAIFKGDTKLDHFDRVLLALALCAFVFLVFVSNKAAAVWITLFTLCAGFALSMHKAYGKPDEETAKSFVLNALKFLPGILALSSFSFLTIAYPLTAGVGNAALAILIWTRRRRFAAAHADIPS